MGEPKFSRRKYERPMNPWEAERIKEENEILKKYGLKNKKELWRAKSMLRSFRQQSRDLQARLRYNDKQAQKETAQLLSRLKALSMLPENASLDDVLALSLDAILNRRLQTVVYLKGLAGSPTQARQFIVHGHATVAGRRVTIPGYLVKTSEEPAIAYNTRSPIANDLHPARPRKDEFGNVIGGGVPLPKKEEPAPAAAPADGAAPAPAAEPKADEKPETKPEPKPEKRVDEKKAEEKPAKDTKPAKSDAPKKGAKKEG